MVSTSKSAALHCLFELFLNILSALFPHPRVFPTAGGVWAEMVLTHCFLRIVNGVPKRVFKNHSDHLESVLSIIEYYGHGCGRGFEICVASFACLLEKEVIT